MPAFSNTRRAFLLPRPVSKLRGLVSKFFFAIFRFVAAAGRVRTTAAECARRPTGIRAASRPARQSTRKLCRGSAARPGGCVVGRSDGRLFQKLLCRLPESVPRSGPGAGRLRRARVGLSAAIAGRYVQGLGRCEPAARSGWRGVSAAIADPLAQRKPAATERLRSPPAEHVRPLGTTLHTAAGTAGLRSVGRSAELCGTAGSAKCFAHRTAKLRGRALSSPCSPSARAVGVRTGPQRGPSWGLFHLRLASSPVSASV